MKKSLVLFLAFLFSGHLMAQEKNELKIRNNDSLKQAFEERMEEYRLKRRAEIGEYLQRVNPDSVVKLDIKGAGFRDLPDISHFTRVTEINADGNKLSTIDKNSFAWRNLKSINLTGNQLRKIRFPKENSVTQLILTDNDLKRIPRSVRKLKHLKMLDLSRNNIKRIPCFVAKMDSLSEINLDYNQLKLNKKAVKRLAKIETLLLADNKIDALPEQIDLLVGVKKINFSRNSLSELPESFKNLTGLTNLIFYENKFDTMPREIFALINLVEIDFYYNQLVEIPDGLGNLKQLQQLFLSFNNIKSIPDTVRQLTELRYFYIHHNQLTRLPGWITSLHKLQRLDVSYNGLISLPDLSSMESLSELDIQENELAYFPWKLLEMKNLSILIVKNNPFILSSEEKAFLENLNRNPESGGLVLVY